MDIGHCFGQIADPAKLEGGAATGQQDAVERGHQTEDTDADQQVNEGRVLTQHMAEHQHQRVVFGVGGARGEHGGFPAVDANRAEEHQQAQHHQRQQRRAKAEQHVALRVDCLFGDVGHPFNGQKEPDGEGDGGEDAGDAVGQRVDCEVGHLYMGHGQAGKQQQFEHRDHRDHQLKHRGHAHADDVDGGEDEVGDDGDGGDADIGKVGAQVSGDGKGDGWRGEDKLDVLGHAGQKPPVAAQAPVGVLKGAARLGDGAGHLGVAEGEGDIHGDDKQGGDCQPQSATLGQPQVPAEVHA